MRVAQKIGELRITGSFQGWLGAITARQAISHSRRPGHRELAIDPDEMASAVDALPQNDTITARDQLDAKWRQQRVHEAMVHLSPQQRAILTLMLKEDLEPHEVAEKLELGGSQVRSQLHRAIQAIRERLAVQGTTGKRS